MRSLLARGWPMLALALLVRVAQITASNDWPAVSDPGDYVRHALSIAAGNGMAGSTVPAGGPSALRPPLYPYFLGGVFSLTGDSQTAGRIAAALAGVLTVLLIGFIAQLLWNERVALAAMTIAAVYPPLVLVSGTLLSESLALPIVLGLVALLLAYRDEPRPAWVAPAAGLLFGLALLDRPALAVFVVALVAALWWRGALVALAVAAIAITPWTIRNAAEFDAFIPISTQSGFLLAGTYNEASESDPKLPGANRPPGFARSLAPILSDRSLDENEMSKKLGAAARAYAKDHPGYVPRVAWWNGLRLLSLSRGFGNGEVAYAFQGIGRGAARTATVAWLLAALAALAGLVLGAARRWPWWLWATPLLLFLTVIPISGDIRYRLPIEPFVVLAAAFASVAIADRLRDRRPAPQPPPTQPQPR